MCRTLAIALAALAAIFIAASIPTAPANPSYLTEFRGVYPTCTIPDELAITSSACYTCHNSNAFFGDWNCYRRDLISRLRAGRTIKQAIRDIESWDSDGDGTDNLTEILYDRGNGLVGYNPGLVGPLGTDPCVQGVNGSGVPLSTLPVTFQPETPPAATGACCLAGACIVTTHAQCAGPFRRFTGPGSACNAPANFTSPCCAADFDQINGRTIDDIFVYLNAWFAGCVGQNDATCQGITADIDRSGVRTIDDLFIFLSLWFAGC